MDHLKVKHLHCYPYELSLVRPFIVKGGALKKREGVIIRAISEKGHMGFGEAAPLLGMSGEPLKKTIYQLDRLQEELRGLQLPLERDALLRFFMSHFGEELLAPSVRFGLESAFLSLVASVLDMSIAQFLGQKDPATAFSAGLLQGGMDDVCAQLMTLRALGYKVFDLKVGSRNIPFDIQKVEGLKRLMAPQERLRISADGQWSPEEAVIFAQSIGKNQVDFLEEPCRDVAFWEEIYRSTDIPLAIGESLTKILIEDLECSQGIGAVVVRPMIFGGISGFYDVLRLSKDMGKKVIVGGSFESGVGKMMLANLAALTGQVAALGCSAWLKTDLLAKPFINLGGVIFPENLMIKPDMFHSQFKENFEFN